MKKSFLFLSALLALGCAQLFANDQKKEEHQDSKECASCKEKGSQCDDCKKAHESQEKH